jgi:thymidylate synthase ThyX
MSEVILSEPATLNDSSSNANEPSVEVFAVYGVEPEIQAYAMAKYSRSSLSMKESLKEITSQKAEKFLNTFYFQYGHRSIADLAHIALAIERLSILAAIVVADEQRWDGQERSTRYQDFRKSGYYTPEFGDPALREVYRQAVDQLFADYERLSETMFEYLRGITPKPADMKQDAYERTLRARAFDISRYCLPLATNTSLGEIVNARTLETQVAHLLSHTHKEVRDLGGVAQGRPFLRLAHANEVHCGCWRGDRRVSPWPSAPNAIAARVQRLPDAPEVCRSERTKSDAPSNAAGGCGTDARRGHCTCAAGGSAR